MPLPSSTAQVCYCKVFLVWFRTKASLRTVGWQVGAQQCISWSQDPNGVVSWLNVSLGIAGACNCDCHPTSRVNV